MIVLNPDIKKKCMDIAIRFSQGADPYKMFRRLVALCLFIDNDMIFYGASSDQHIHLRALDYGQIIEKVGDKHKLRIPLYIDTKANSIKQENPFMDKRNARQLVEERVDEYRAAFSRRGEGKIGLRPGALGDKRNIVKKLTKWFIDTKFQYTMDDVINTAKVYTVTCQGDNYKFLQAADYFIDKDGRSKLSSFIDEFKDKSISAPASNTFDI